MNFLFLMMGGSGTRVGLKIPKQFVEIDNKPIFSYILDDYDMLACIDRIVIVSNPNWMDYMNDWIASHSYTHKVTAVPGGNSRSESILNGLRSVKDEAKDDDVVLFHDATHPYVDAKGTMNVIDAVHEFGGATLGGPQYDTCYSTDDENMIREVVPRKTLFSGASPEGFLFGDMYRIYTTSTEEELNNMSSAGAMALANNIRMKVIPMDILNLKITYLADIRLFDILHNTYFFDRQ